ncbi:MAG TPA: FKBP-type peptidyl-prolyl cis-trans isomerase [Candidatus Angelobacter sp.]
MKKSIVLGIIYTLATALPAGIAAAQTNPSPKPQTTPAARPPAAPTPAAKPTPSSPFKTDKEKDSYAIGMNIGTGLRENLTRQSVDVDYKLLLQGLQDSLSGGKTLMTEEEARAALTQLQNDLRAKQEEKQKEAAGTNKKEGEAFLAANKTKDGVVTLPSGLQYKILTPGTGPKPVATDTVSVNYRGTLINGKEFDSSAKSGKPVTFQVGGVIKGWTEALQLMPVGSKWQLWIPPDLAYGPQQRGPDIGPNSTLVFEVELLSIEPKK